MKKTAAVLCKVLLKSISITSYKLHFQIVVQIGLTFLNYFGKVVQIQNAFDGGN